MQAVHTCQRVASTAPSLFLGAAISGRHSCRLPASSSPISRGLVCRADAGPARPGPPDLSNGASAGEFGIDLDPGVRLECDESGCVLVLPKKEAGVKLEDEMSDSDGVLQCNVSGCFYGPDPGASEFTVLEGSGWRLGFETVPSSEDSFSAMVGAGGWSIALTASEFNDFCKLVQMLRKGIITMDQDGVLGRDDIVMQVEVGSMWMECVVPKKVLPTLQKFLQFGGRAGSSAFEIRFILTGKTDKRQAEGYWPADAVLDMLRKIDDLTKGAPAGETAGESKGVPVSA